jgi:hypothetical protein
MTCILSFFAGMIMGAWFGIVVFAVLTAGKRE